MDNTTVRTDNLSVLEKLERWCSWAERELAKRNRGEENHATEGDKNLNR